MHYSAQFSATALDGHSSVTPTIGAAYASLSSYEGPVNSGQITLVPPRSGRDHVVFLTFERLEDFVVDLYRMRRDQFHLYTYRFIFTNDGGCVVCNENTSCVGIADLQEFIIANYAKLKCPVFFQLNLRTHKWKYYGELADEKKFEIF